ncbi:MAG TPA: cytochrome c [Chitinophagaceae bacterium]|nr:cytochrome c [Chitinophagaceae bacterium]
MMKKIWIITGCLTMIAVLAGCDKTRRSPGRAYMPDMSYSRAYETYSSTENLKENGINYTARPVEGTIARGDMASYENKNDSTGYARSAVVKNPLDFSTIDMKEAERLYLVNCAICHGSKLDGNGPLWNGGDGPYPAAPKNLLADDMKAMTEGTMFHSLTYGKNLMGSYASQLSTLQRWEVIAYIKMKQGGTATTTTTVVADTTAAAIK